jgi:hypothetical protein
MLTNFHYFYLGSSVKKATPQAFQNRPFPEWRNFYKIKQSNGCKNKKRSIISLVNVYPFDWPDFLQESGFIFLDFLKSRSRFEKSLTRSPIPKEKAGGGTPAIESAS